MRLLFSLFTSSVTCTSAPTKSTDVTLPTSTPATRTIAPDLIPWTFLNFVFSSYRCQANPPWPPTATMIMMARIIATTATIPILSSAQASDRVLGMSVFVRSREKRVDIGILRGRVPELLGVAFEADPAIFEHDELRFVGLSGRRRVEPDLGGVLDGHVLSDEERVAQLVRDHDGAHPFEIAQLDDLFVDCQRRNRIEAGRRLIVEKDARLGRHRPGDCHAPALPA